MAIDEHYLIEDREALFDELENMHKAFMNVLDSATEADFIHNKQNLEQIDHSLKVILALNQKKLNRDLVMEEAVIRRNWF